MPKIKGFILSMPKTKDFILDIAKTKGFSEKRRLLKQESKNKNKTKTKGQSATPETCLHSKFKGQGPQKSFNNLWISYFQIHEW